MAEKGKTNSKRKDEKLLFQKAIPKIASALHSIIAKTKDKDFQARCMQGAQASHLDALSEKFELKLWEIARSRMGVCRLNPDENQVVPQISDSHQNTSSSQQEAEKLRNITSCSYTENSLSELASFDYYSDCTQDSIEKDKDVPTNYSFPTNTLTNNLETSPKATFPNTRSNLPDIIYVDDDLQMASNKEDWLDDFAQDCYWMDETSCNSSVQEMAVSCSKKDGNMPNGHLFSSAESVGRGNVNTVVVDEVSSTGITHSKEPNTGIECCDENKCTPENRRNLDRGCESLASGITRVNKDAESDPANFKSLAAHHITEITPEGWLSFQERNTLIDDFEALGDFFDD